MGEQHTRVLVVAVTASVQAASASPHRPPREGEASPTTPQDGVLVCTISLAVARGGLGARRQKLSPDFAHMMARSSWVSSSRAMPVS